jgi:hypothetical protein
MHISSYFSQYLHSTKNGATSVISVKKAPNDNNSPIPLTIAIPEERTPPSANRGFDLSQSTRRRQIDASSSVNTHLRAYNAVNKIRTAIVTAK